MRLRDVQLDDVDSYVRIRTDPVMMAELGGPMPRDGIEDTVRRHVAEAASGEAWISMILPDDTNPALVAGTVVLWSHDDDRDGSISEIGWMVLPEFQGRGIGKSAVRLLLDRARTTPRWGTIHAFAGIANHPSNGICRSLGFTLIGQRPTTFAGRTFPTNHWTLNPAT